MKPLTAEAIDYAVDFIQTEGLNMPPTLVIRTMTKEVKHINFIEIPDDPIHLKAFVLDVALAHFAVDAAYIANIPAHEQVKVFSNSDGIVTTYGFENTYYVAVTYHSMLDDYSDLYIAELSKELNHGSFRKVNIEKEGVNWVMLNLFEKLMLN